MAAAWFLALLVLVPAHAGSVDARVRASGVVRVCIWPDYFGITYRHPQTRELRGIDIELSAQLAHDLGARVEYVDSSFATLIADVTEGRCDVAMFAVGRLPQRMEHLRFSRPYLASGIYGITTKGSRVVRGWDDIDKAGVLVGVQAGTFMEGVMADYLKSARMVLVKPPVTRERELQAGRIDVFMTDFPYSHGLLENADWAVRVAPAKPFFVLPYGYAVKPGDEDWFQKIDQFVARIQRDGRLQEAAGHYGLSPIVARP